MHDNRVFGHMRVNRNHSEHFSSSEYIHSDSALENCNSFVLAFKKPQLQPLLPHNERINTRLASARIFSEHTIGILKGRFPWLKCIKKIVSDDNMTMLRILKYIDS